MNAGSGKAGIACEYWVILLGHFTDVNVNAAFGEGGSIGRPLDGLCQKISCIHFQLAALGDGTASSLGLGGWGRLKGDGHSGWALTGIVERHLGEAGWGIWRVGAVGRFGWLAGLESPSLRMGLGGGAGV